MIDQVRPGGLVAVITSKGTLDKSDNRARTFFARRADLVKAIRLLKMNLILQSTNIFLNIRKIFWELWKRPSSYFTENGEIKFFDGVKVSTVKINGNDRAKLLSAMKMRDAVREVIDVQVDDGTDYALYLAQQQLNNIYDRYIKLYGYICEDANLKKIFSNDAAYPLLRSLEVYDKEGYKGKSPVFNKRMIEPHRTPTYADNSADALAISMQELGKVDLNYMKGLTWQSDEDILKDLEFERIYYDFQKKRIPNC